MRDVMVDAVKSLETEQIRDQKRIRFVDDIYDASMAEDGDFLSPLRRKNDPEMDRLRAQRKGPRAGDDRARDGARRLRRVARQVAGRRRGAAVAAAGRLCDVGAVEEAAPVVGDPPVGDVEHRLRHALQHLSLIHI